MQFNVQPIYMIGLDYERAWACLNRPELTETLNEMLLFVFLALQPIVVVLSQPSSGL
jgi:hypothetical protein